MKCLRSVKPLALFLHLLGSLRVFLWSNALSAVPWMTYGSGLWCVIAMVPYCNVFLDTKDYVLMSTRAVSAFMEDDLHILMGFLACGPAEVDPTSVHIFATSATSYPVLDYLDVCISDTDCSSFVVAYINKKLEDMLSTMVQLYSEKSAFPVSLPQALKAFSDFYPTMGLLGNMMVTPPKSVTS
uniref:Uncharacterized protein n=1 Tax=Mus spicilegus TaxID=10103 RepID=A0A8C6N0L5_MUSSI